MRIKKRTVSDRENGVDRASVDLAPEVRLAPDQRDLAVRYTVEPPLWRRPGLLMAAAGFMGTVALFARRLRRARRRYQEIAAREERIRIARELHDGVAQKLAAIGLLADRARLGRDGHHDAELKQMRHILHETHLELRRAIWDMRHEDSRERPTSQRLEPLIERSLAELIVPPGIEVRLQTAETSLAVGELAAHEVPLVAKEAVSNAIRHAQASVVEIGLISDEEGVDLWVRDDGCGLPDLASAARGTGCGVVGMYERARRLGGQLAIRRLARGTEVRLSVPRAWWTGLACRMRNTPDGAGNLLDNSVLYTTSCCSESQSHGGTDYPIVVSGKAGGKLKGDVHIRLVGENVSRVGFTLLTAIGSKATSWGMGDSATSAAVSELLA